VQEEAKAAVYNVGISNNLNGKHILDYRLCTTDKAELIWKECSPWEPNGAQ
jgi:hypothetical protein